MSRLDARRSLPRTPAKGGVPHGIQLRGLPRADQKGGAQENKALHRQKKATKVVLREGGAPPLHPAGAFGPSTPTRDSRPWTQGLIKTREGGKIKPELRGKFGPELTPL
jgi:hypothetical protein